MKVSPIPLAALMLSACANPVHDAEVQQLGPEAAGIPAGEFHRAGQPCALCHSESGPAKTRFTMAGTIFFYGLNGTAISRKGVDVATVNLIDSSGATWSAQTNCVGNFWVAPGQWEPAYPVRVAGIAYPDQNNNPVQSANTMVSHISREPSCGFCHNDPPYQASPGHVYIQRDQMQMGGVNYTVNMNCPAPADLGDIPTQ